MRILFDQGVPAPLSRHLAGHEVDTVFQRGWSELDNGALLDQAEEDGYQLLVTTDQHLRYQQNLSGETASDYGIAGRVMAAHPTPCC